MSISGVNGIGATAYAYMNKEYENNRGRQFW